jgi:hypothetical protein
MFIKLNKLEEYTAGQYFAVYINIDKISEFFGIRKFGIPCTNVYMGKEYFTAKETPEEIMKLIKEATTPTFSFEGSNIDGGNIGLQVKNCCHTSDEASK